MRYGLTNSEIMNTLSSLRVPCSDLTLEQVADAVRLHETVLKVQRSKLAGVDCVLTSRLSLSLFQTRNGRVLTIGVSPLFRDRLWGLPRLTVSREAQAWHALSRRVANSIVSKLDLPDLHGEDDYEGSAYHFNLPENCNVD